MTSQAAAYPPSTKMAPISASQTSARIAVLLRPPELASEAPSSDHIAKVYRPCHIGACLPAYEVCEAARHLPFVSLGKGAKQHVGYCEAQDMVAEKFEPLVGASAVAQPW